MDSSSEFNIQWKHPVDAVAVGEQCRLYINNEEESSSPVIEILPTILGWKTGRFQEKTVPS